MTKPNATLVLFIGLVLLAWAVVQPGVQGVVAIMSGVLMGRGMTYLIWGD